MSRLHPVPPRKLLAVLSDEGFERVGQRGSHVKCRHPDGRVVIVPVHPGKDLKVGLLRALLRDAGIRPDDFLDRV